jgi:hypothetical protein
MFLRRPSLFKSFDYISSDFQNRIKNQEKFEILDFGIFSNFYYNQMKVYSEKAFANLNEAQQKI